MRELVMAEISKRTFDYFKGESINPDLVTVWAQEWADKFFPRQGGQQRQGRQITSAQLRRFYGDVKNLEMRLENSADKDKAFSEILPMIKLLKAKAAYAKSRGLVPDNFKDWIWENVDMINGIRDFKAFLLYFEAVVGFCYGNGLDVKD